MDQRSRSPAQSVRAVGAGARACRSSALLTWLPPRGSRAGLAASASDFSSLGGGKCSSQTGAEMFREVEIFL